MSEHQVVVVLDITASDRFEAARAVVHAFAQDVTGRTPLFNRPDVRIESWWFPEADLKQIDRNDNAAMHLEDDEIPVDIVVTTGKDSGPAVWFHPEGSGPVPLLGREEIFDALGTREAAEAFWAHATRGLPVDPPRTVNALAKEWGR